MVSSRWHMLKLALTIAVLTSFVPNRQILSSATETHAGISVEVTNNTLGYFVRLARQVVPKILNDVRLPNFEGAAYAISDMVVVDVPKPIVKAVFARGKGFIVNASLPSMKVLGKYSLGVSWVSTQGLVEGILHDFTFDSMITIQRGRNGHPIFSIKDCVSNVTNITLRFEGSWSSYVGNSVSELISDFIKSYLSGFLCELLYFATQEFDETAPGYCETHDAYTNVGGQLSLQSTDFSVNFTLNDDPSFFNGMAFMGLNGSILYTGKERPVYRARPVHFHPVEMHHTLNPYRMARVTISDYVGNTFFHNVFKYNMAKMNRSVSARRLPKVFWGPAGFFCRKCQALIQGGMTAPPELRIEAGKGVKLGIHGWVRSILYAFYRRVELFQVKTLVGVNVYPYISNQKLFANTLLHDIRISTRDARGSLSRVFGFSMKGLVGVLKSFLPAQIKPPVQRDLRKVFGKKGGMPLPSFCGITFLRPRIFYIKDAMVIDADVEFDTQPLVRLLRELIQTGGEMRRNVTQARMRKQ